MQEPSSRVCVKIIKHAMVWFAIAIPVIAESAPHSNGRGGKAVPFNQVVNVPVRKPPRWHRPKVGALALIRVGKYVTRGGHHKLRQD